MLAHRTWLGLRLAVSMVCSLAMASTITPAAAQQPRPYGEGAQAPQAGGSGYPRPDDAYRPAAPRQYGAYPGGAGGDAYVAPPPGSGVAQAPPGEPAPRYTAEPPGAYGQPYERSYGAPYSGEPPPPPPGYGGPPPGTEPTYSRSEILDAGHRFFGSVSRGLAEVVEYAFQKSGRPNGYILGEDAGGAFIAGLRYGEGTLYTKNAGIHKVFWQGPSVGYDFGGEGSKTMVLVYNLRDPYEIYDRFAGVQGSAYLVGGVGIQFQKSGEVVLAPIRSGVGLRFGANIGYLKYTRAPTWNPF